MKVIVIGGAGYVGSVLTRQLVAEGHQVTVCDRGYFGLDSLDGLLDKITLIESDMRLLEVKDFKGFEAVIFLSGLSNDPMANFNPEANEQLNYKSPVELAHMAKEAGVKRYVFASTCSVYDFGDSELKDTEATEESPVNPKSYYASSKYKAEEDLEILSDENFEVICLRKGTVYGYSPRMRYDLVVNTFVKSAMTTGKLDLHNGGEIWRPLIDVRDAADAYVRAIMIPLKNNFEVINVSKENYRISEVAIQIQKALSEKGIECSLNPQYTNKAVRNYRVDNSKMKKLLKLEPQYNILESVGYIVDKIIGNNKTDFDNPIYYNINWMKLLLKFKTVVDGYNGKVF